MPEQCLKGPARDRVPQPRGAVLTSGQYALAVWAERHSANPTGVWQPFADRCPRGHVPALRLTLRVSDEEGLAVGAEGHHVEATLVKHGLADALAGVRVPQLEAIIRAGGKSLAVGAEERTGVRVAHGKDVPQSMNLLAPGGQVGADELLQVAGIGRRDLDACQHPV